MGNVKEDLVNHLYDKPIMLTTEDIGGGEDIGKQVYSTVRNNYLKDFGDPERANVAGRMALKGLEKVKKSGLIPFGIIKSLTTKARGSYKFQMLYRPGFGPAKDHSVVGEMIVSKTSSKHPGISFNFGVKPEMPRSSEFEYDALGNQWEFAVHTPKYELPGGMQLAGQTYGSQNISVKNPLLHSTPTTMRKIHQMKDIPPLFYKNNVKRKEDARIMGRKEPAQWKRHKSNPEWVMLSPGRGRHDLKKLERAAKASLSGDPDNARIRWAFTGVVRIGYRTIRVRQGQPVSREEYEAFYRGILDTVETP